MKTVTRFFPLMVTLLIIGMACSANAQGRGHHKGHHRHEWKYDDHHYRSGHHHRPEVRHVVHHHDHYCNHAPVVVSHYQPRYIYYRDYDVYYDTHNSVYISYSGRNWTVSASLPVVLRRIDMHRVVAMEVDYYQDDFPRYLERNRPSYRRIYTSY